VERELGRLGPQAGSARLLGAWREAVGETIATHAWPARLARDGTLHVATSSSVWAFELTQLAPLVLERLRGHLAEAAPARLRFAPGNVPEPSAETAEPARAEGLVASQGDRAEGERVAESIEDEELRSLVARAVAATLAKGGSDRSF
jgi:hypothetical protein